jgi:hypothetical protein
VLRIKSPISIIEQNYNKRYEPETQRIYLNMIDQRKLDKYANDFIMSCKFNDAAGNLILTEKQADYLADLYTKYSS